MKTYFYAGATFQQVIRTNGDEEAETIWVTKPLGTGQVLEEVNTLETPLPRDFLGSKNEKFIHVIGCRVVYKGSLVGDIMVHANFVNRNPSMDSFICFANEYLPVYKTYDYTNCRRPTFKVRFTDMNQNEIIPDSFLLELMLEF